MHGHGVRVDREDGVDLDERDGSVDVDISKTEGAILGGGIAGFRGVMTDQKRRKSAV